MQHLSRRTALAGASAALVTAALPSAAAFAAAGDLEIEGCCLRDDQRGIFASKLLGSVYGSADLGDLATSSGNRIYDRYLGKALLRLSDNFKVYPGFSFIDDGELRNAFAWPGTLMQGTRGTVFFGLSLFRECMARAHDDGLTVISICAHEFGHIVQYHTGYYFRLRRGQETVKLVELHADYLAGFFLAARKRENPNLPLQDIGRTFEEMGDTHYMLLRHHGTPAERIAAIEAGYFLGKSGVDAITQAVETGVQFVRRFT